MPCLFPLEGPKKAVSPGSGPGLMGPLGPTAYTQGLGVAHIVGIGNRWEITKQKYENNTRQILEIRIPSNWRISVFTIYLSDVVYRVGFVTGVTCTTHLSIRQNLKILNNYPQCLTE